MSCMDTLIDTISDIGEKVFCRTVNMITNGVKTTLRQTQMVFKKLIEAIQDAMETNRIKKERIKEETRLEMEHILTLYKLNVNHVEESYKRFEFSEDVSARELDFKLKTIKEKIFEDQKIGLDTFFDPELIERLQSIQNVKVQFLSQSEMAAFKKKLSEIVDMLHRSEQEGSAIVHAIRGEEYNPEMIDKQLTVEQVQFAVRHFITLVQEIERGQGCRHPFPAEGVVKGEENIVIANKNENERLTMTQTKQREVVKK